MLGALVVVGVLWVSDLVVGWAPRSLLPVVMVIVLASNVFTFRLLWKQSDHPAFHKDPRGSDSKPHAPGDSESGR